MVDPRSSVVAGMWNSDPSLGSNGQTVLLAIMMLDRSPRVMSLSPGIRKRLRDFYAKEQASGALADGPMPDTYNKDVRQAEWDATSSSMSYNSDNFTAEMVDAALVSSIRLEIAEGLIVLATFKRLYGEDILLALDPVARAAFERLP